MKRLCAQRSKRPGDAGAALVELTVVAPLLLVLLIGIIEFARYATFAIMVGNAARAGVQYGSNSLVTALDGPGMQNAALNDGQNIPGLSVTSTSHFCKCADGTASTCAATDCPANHRIVYVQVNTAGTFHSIASFPGIPSTFNVNGIAVMRVAQ
jgi:Flp pilus assembly protein TadG